MKCNYCGNKVEKVIITDDGYELCPDCFEAKAICCDSCGGVVLKHKTTVDEYELCLSCYETRTVCCDSCGDIYYNSDDLIATEDGDEICDYCYEEHYFTCSHCDEVHHNDNSHETADGLVCDYCYRNNYIECEHCDEVVSRDHIYFTGDDYTLCEECLNSCTYQDEDGEYWYSPNGNVIKNYSYKPEPVFRGEGPLFFGIELEVGKILDESSRQELAETLLNEIGGTIYIKDDGSLENGFEIVTHPLSFNFIKNSQFFENIESVLYGKAHAYNKGGMHVHINRNAFVAAYHLQNFVKFINRYKGFSSFIAQRKSDEWAKFYYPDSLNKIGLGCIHNPNESGRYMSVNFENAHTIEVRIFNANILANRNYKNVEFLHAIFEFSKNNTPNINKFLAFIGGNKELYPNLFSFIKERRKSFLKSLKEIFLSGQENFKLLAKFLKEKRLFTYYIEIVNKKTLLSTLKEDPKGVLNYPISWNDTAQGYKFWYELNNEWGKYYKEATNA